VFAVEVRYNNGGERQSTSEVGDPTRGQSRWGNRESMGTFFTSWMRTRPEPRAQREHRTIFSVYRRPYYHRPPRPSLSPVQTAVPLEPWTGIQSRPLYTKAHWLSLAVSIHIILLGCVAAVTLPQRSAGMRPGAPVTVKLLPLPYPVPDGETPELRAGSQETSGLPSRAEEAFATIQRLRTDVTERAERLEQRLVQLAETTTTDEQTILRQRHQLAQAQEETARIAEDAARRTAQEGALAARLAEEQARSAQLEAEIVEQRRQQEAALKKTRGTYDALIDHLQKEIANRDITIREANDKLAINIVDRVLFPSGQATLTAEGTQVLEKVGRVLQTVPGQRIQIEGHTDNREISPGLKKTFASNWELSTARATEVVKYFLAHSHLPAERLLAVGRADTVPVATNTTEEGRQQNRRIEILLLPPERIGAAKGGSGSRAGTAGGPA